MYCEKYRAKGEVVVLPSFSRLQALSGTEGSFTLLFGEMLQLILYIVYSRIVRNAILTTLLISVAGGIGGGGFGSLEAEAAGKFPSGTEICGIYTCESIPLEQGGSGSKQFEYKILKQGDGFLVQGPENTAFLLTYNPQTGKGKGVYRIPKSPFSYHMDFTFSMSSKGYADFEAFGRMEGLNLNVGGGEMGARSEQAILQGLAKARYRIVGHMMTPAYPSAPVPAAGAAKKEQVKDEKPAPAEEHSNPEDSRSDEEYDHDNLPGSEEEIAGAAAVTALGGAALGLGGAVAGAAASGSAGSLGGIAGNFGPNFYRDTDGDLHIKDSTGKERIYKDQGDGTYREIGGFGKVTVRDLADEARRIQENEGYYQHTERIAQEGLGKQRQDAGEMSQTLREVLALKREEEAEDARELYRSKLRQKYGDADDDLMRKAIQDKMDWNAERARKQEAIGKGFDVALKAAETTQVIADVGVNVLATATGQTGIRDAYTATKNLVGRLTDAAVNDKNLGTALAQGALDTLADLTTNKLENAGWHITGNAASAGFKKMVDNACNDKPLLEGVGTGTVVGGAAGLASKGVDALNNWAGRGISEQANNYVHGGMTGMRHNLNIKKVCTEAEFRAIENLRLTSLLESVRGMHTANTMGTGLVEGTKWALGEVGKEYSKYCIEDNNTKL